MASSPATESVVTVLVYIDALLPLETQVTGVRKAQAYALAVLANGYRHATNHFGKPIVDYYAPNRIFKVRLVGDVGALASNAPVDGRILL